MTLFLICTALAVLIGYIMEEYRDNDLKFVFFTVVMGILMGDNEVVLKLTELFFDQDPNVSYVLGAAYFTFIAVSVSLWRAWVSIGKTDIG